MHTLQHDQELCANFKRAAFLERIYADYYKLCATCIY